MDRDRRHTHSVTLPGEQIVTYSPQESAYLESNIGVSGHHNNNDNNNNNKHVPPPPPPPTQNIFPVGYIQPQHLISLQERVCFEQFPFNGIFNSSFWQIILSSFQTVEHAGKSHEPESAKIPPGSGPRRHVSAGARGTRVWTRGSSRELHHTEATDGAQTGAECRGRQADDALHVPGGRDSDQGHDTGARLHLGHAQILRLHLASTQTKVRMSVSHLEGRGTEQRTNIPCFD